MIALPVTDLFFMLLKVIPIQIIGTGSFDIFLRVFMWSLIIIALLILAWFYGKDQRRLGVMEGELKSVKNELKDHIVTGHTNFNDILEEIKTDIEWLRRNR